MVTIEVNERTKAGKAILELVKLFSDKEKGVKIVEPVNNPSAKEYPVSKNTPNAITRKGMKEAEKGIGVSEPKEVDEFLKEMDSW
ncbi:hypothetical protein SAMN05444483_104105 [Salegentibacter echinorum]|uniref:Uncharacterized protein n=1 Tax=Salegentibacter echinorum TaxID=1073325 RepID=A0A1M5GDL1_SALEC|nr:hypothetical protein [Salegentibacter echinorum]SHG01581.1 hypothetical protein SAMN05444483_104105 [Salegentibacter echinorum]